MTLGKLKQEALDRTLGRTHFERACRHVANRLQNEWWCTEKDTIPVEFPTGNLQNTSLCC